MNRFSVGAVCFFICLFLFPFSEADDRRETAFCEFQSGKCETNHETFAGNKTAILEMANNEVNSSTENSRHWYTELLFEGNFS